MESLTIGQLAQRAGVGVETVRFYEREGPISEPPRRQSPIQLGTGCTSDAREKR